MINAACFTTSIRVENTISFNNSSVNSNKESTNFLFFIFFYILGQISF